MPSPTKVRLDPTFSDFMTMSPISRSILIACAITCDTVATVGALNTENVESSKLLELTHTISARTELIARKTRLLHHVLKVQYGDAVADFASRLDQTLMTKTGAPFERLINGLIGELVAISEFNLKWLEIQKTQNNWGKLFESMAAIGKNTDLLETKVQSLLQTLIHFFNHSMASEGIEQLKMLDLIEMNGPTTLNRPGFELTPRSWTVAVPPTIPCLSAGTPPG